MQNSFQTYRNEKLEKRFQMYTAMQEQPKQNSNKLQKSGNLNVN